MLSRGGWASAASIVSVRELCAANSAPNKRGGSPDGALARLSAPVTPLNDWTIRPVTRWCVQRCRTQRSGNRCCYRCLFRKCEPARKLTCDVARFGFLTGSAGRPVDDLQRLPKKREKTAPASPCHHGAVAHRQFPCLADVASSPGCDSCIVLGRAIAARRSGAG